MTTFIIAILVIAIINNLSPMVATTVEPMAATPANRRTLKANTVKRRTRQASFSHRVERRLRKGVRVTSQPTQTKRQGHWHVPEAPKGATHTPGSNPLARRFNATVNNLRARRRALKRLASGLEFDPEYIFT